MFNEVRVKAISAFIMAIIALSMQAEFSILFLTIIALLIIWSIADCYTKTQPPTVIVANILAFACTISLFLIIGLNELVNLFIGMLLQANCLKLLVAKQKRHYKIIILINFFLTACIFLFYQSLLTTITAVCLFILNMIAMFLAVNKSISKRTTKRTLQLLVMSLPITLVLFIFVPKLSSFWKMPNLSSSQVGLSESVNPFSISDLSKSEELAFRANVPSSYSAPFYWRTMVHEEFDGQSWNILRNASEPSLTLAKPITQKNVTVYHERTTNAWLPGFNNSLSPQSNIYTTKNGNLRRRKTSNQAFTYEFFPVDKTKVLSTRTYEQNLTLPVTDNVKTVQLALNLKQKSKSTQEFIALLSSHFVQQNYIYTLKPPIYSGSNSIDAFMVEGKQGFCGHYASSAAFIFRTAGIPARVVSGYLGAEQSANGQFYSIYQYDAHAWVEVWVDGKGWQVFDATEFVEPDRLYGSLSQLETTREDFETNVGLGLTSLSNYAMFNYIRLYFDTLDYQWTAWVLNFDNTKQKNLIKKLVEDVSPLKIAFMIIAPISLFLSLIFIYKVWQARPQYDDAIVYSILALERFAKRNQLARQNGETISQFITRLKQSFPEKKTHFDGFITLYSRHRYGEKPLSRAQQKALKYHVRNIKNKRQL